MIFSGMVLFQGEAVAALTMDVVSLDGSADINFGEIDPQGQEGSMRTKEVRLIINNSPATRYAVSQIFQSPAIAREGGLFDMSLIRFYAKIRQGNGELRAMNPVPISNGEQEIFISDGVGENTELILYYMIDITDSSQAGFYNTSIQYKATTI